jgi:hypothetical protein
MSSMEQLLASTGYMQNFEPLSDDERAVIARALAIVKEQAVIPPVPAVITA